MIKKEYLDHLYQQRFMWMEREKAIKAKIHEPQAMCCSNMIPVNDNHLKYQEAKDATILINQNIETYINVHSK